MYKKEKKKQPREVKRVSDCKSGDLSNLGFAKNLCFTHPTG
jgi:hypothetical protein